MSENEVVKIDFDAWYSKGVELFGKDVHQWRFVCPSCGNIQKRSDFVELGLDESKIANIFYFSCIGRWNGHSDVPMLSGKSPCNYTNGGLINISKTMVIKEGKEILVFAFDET